MKLIPLKEFPGLKTTEIIKAVIERPGPNGVGVSEFAGRIRVLKALETATPDRLSLEDADHATLVGAVNQFRFGMVSVELAEIVDDIMNAKEPPKDEIRTAGGVGGT